MKEGLLLRGGARASELGDPNGIVRERGMSISEISSEIAPVLIDERQLAALLIPTKYPYSSGIIPVHGNGIDMTPGAVT